MTDCGKVLSVSVQRGIPKGKLSELFSLCFPQLHPCKSRFSAASDVDRLLLMFSVICISALLQIIDLRKRPFSSRFIHKHLRLEVIPANAGWNDLCLFRQRRHD